MIARAFIAQRPVDENEIGRLAVAAEPARRRHTDEQPTAAGKQLLGDQHRKGRTDCTADDAKLDAAVVKHVELGMIAGPTGMKLRPATGPEPAHHIAVGVENADGGDAAFAKSLLP